MGMGGAPAGGGRAPGGWRGERRALLRKLLGLYRRGSVAGAGAGARGRLSDTELDALGSSAVCADVARAAPVELRGAPAEARPGLAPLADDAPTNPFLSHKSSVESSPPDSPVINKAETNPFLSPDAVEALEERALSGKLPARGIPTAVDLKYVPRGNVRNERGGEQGAGSNGGEPPAPRAADVRLQQRRAQRAAR